MTHHDPLDPSRAAVRSDLFGGRGEVRVWDLGARTPPFTAVLFCELAPDGRIGAHREESDEVVIVVGGAARIHVGATPHECAVGSAVALPLGATLRIDNASASAPLRYLIVKAHRS
jgi:quercetin dioxygenase-like cupin family protein